MDFPAPFGAHLWIQTPDLNRAAESMGTAGTFIWHTKAEFGDISALIFVLLPGMNYSNPEGYPQILKSSYLAEAVRGECPDTFSTVDTTTDAANITATTYSTALSPSFLRNNGMEQHTGFEPVISAWKADVLPLTPMLHNHASSRLSKSGGGVSTALSLWAVRRCSPSCHNYYRFVFRPAVGRERPCLR